MDPMEGKWEKLLRIRTAGRDASRSDQNRYPYEPTPYSVLDRLAGSGYLNRNNALLDYGCGKGRVGFFLSYRTGCTSYGVDFDLRMIEACEENRRRALSGPKTTFVHGDAGSYKVPRSVDRCWFFNPFSEEVLRRVLGRLRVSLEGNPRELLLFFYYPEDETLSLLNTTPGLSPVGEVDCRDLFPDGSSRERIVIYSMTDRRSDTPWTR